jgi:hypothetical protein
MSAGIRDYKNVIIPIPAGPGGHEMPATFAHFAIAALTTAYQDEQLQYEAKVFRINLANRIRQNMTAVDLTFVERMLIVQLVNNITQIPVIFQRFVELLERCDIPAACNFPFEVPVQTKVENGVELISTDEVSSNTQDTTQ